MIDIRARRLVATVASVLLVQACLFAAAGAGAAGGVYLTTRGAESVVEGTVPFLAQRTESILAERSIVLDETATKSGGDEREYKGKTGDLDVTVKLKREDPSHTKIEVTARRNLAEWDKKYAQELLARIIG